MTYVNSVICISKSKYKMWKDKKQTVRSLSPYDPSIKLLPKPTEILYSCMPPSHSAPIIWPKGIFFLKSNIILISLCFVEYAFSYM